MYMHMDGAWDTFWIKSQNGTFIAFQMKAFGPKIFWIPCINKKVPFWQFYQKSALLVQPSISAHRKWPEMVESASTNQEWTKITIRSYAWSFSIQNQIEAVCSLSELVKEWMPNTVAIWPQTNFFPRIMGYSCKCKQHLLTFLHTFFQKLFSFCNGK